MKRNGQMKHVGCGGRTTLWGLQRPPLDGQMTVLRCAAETSFDGLSYSHHLGVYWVTATYHRCGNPPPGYSTEKLLQSPLVAGTIPVALGAPDVDRLPAPDGYNGGPWLVNALKFKNAKALGAHLHLAVLRRGEVEEQLERVVVTDLDLGLVDGGRGVGDDGGRLGLGRRTV